MSKRIVSLIAAVVFVVAAVVAGTMSYSKNLPGDIETMTRTLVAASGYLDPYT